MCVPRRLTTLRVSTACYYGVAVTADTNNITATTDTTSDITVITATTIAVTAAAATTITSTLTAVTAPYKILQIMISQTVDRNPPNGSRTTARGIAG
jgi:hypothetical protein